MELKILTLNCWGVPVPVVCKHRRERMKAIADRLSRGDYDIVVLQEIWSSADFDSIKDRVLQALPHSHYFHSGIIGSGVCVFSKGRILETFFHQYSLNGYIHKIHHGDWFGGKGVGLCKIHYNGLTFNVYGTHVHAEYCRSDDEYLAHRVSQSFELSQFIKYTSDSAQLSVLCGDLNLEPVDLGYHLIRSNAQLQDAWLVKVTGAAGDAGTTCDTPTNCYTDRKCLREQPEGKRIDYIMFKEPDTGMKVRCDSCQTTMGVVPGQSYNFSDHEGVTATLTVTDSQHTPPNTPRRADVSVDVTETLLRGAIKILEGRLGRTVDDRRWYSMLVLLSTVLLCVLSPTASDPYLYLVTSLVRLALSVVLTYSIVMGLLWNVFERKSLVASQNNMRHLMGRLSPPVVECPPLAAHYT